MPYSKEDQRKYHKQYYLDHKDEYIARANARRAEQYSARQALIREAKDKPCADCGVKYPYYVMQFDHRGDKLFHIASFSITGRLAVLLAEIAKCDVVCANCHAERTHQQRLAGVAEASHADARAD